jgi:hypothetical protein
MVIKNSKRSGGPKTYEGKLAASQNSLKTGSYSSLVVLPNESEAEFNQLLDQFNHDFKPVDVIEKTMINELVVITWKKLRLEKLEQSHLMIVLDAPVKREELIEEGLEILEEVYKRWIKGDFDDSSSIEPHTKAVEAIKELQGKRLVTLQDLLNLKEHHSFVYESLISSYKENFPLIYDDLDLEDVIYKLAKLPDQKEDYFIKIFFKMVLPAYRNAIWVFKNKAVIDRAVSNIKQKRLVALLQKDGLRRANDDLSRALMRVLTEFRKHNHWRLQHRVIDAEG